MSDSELLANTRHLVSKSNQVFAALLVHLAEVESRGLHRTRACASLYTYCIYELQMSEDAAARRASAAKLVKRFPVLFEVIANGELHLTGLLMLGPHLTAENHLDVLARAKFRTKKEIAKLVRTLAPLPEVPDSIEPLRAAPPKSLRNGSWAEWAAALSPAVRELRPGERPCDWANDPLDHREQSGGAEALLRAEGMMPAAGPVPHDDHAPAPARVADGDALARVADGDALARVADGDALARVAQLVDLTPLTPPLLYQMQFTTSDEHVQLVERAKALLSHRSPAKALGELHLEAMRLLVAALEKQRFGAPRSAGANAPNPTLQAQPASEPDATTHPDQVEADEAIGVGESGNHMNTVGTKPDEHPRRRGRHVPAAVRRAVFERDGARCSYVDDRGQRCRETDHLELHHLKPYGRDGQHDSANLALRCRPHNTLAAEQDFGRELIQRKLEALEHLSLRRANQTEK